MSSGGSVQYGPLAGAIAAIDRIDIARFVDAFGLREAESRGCCHVLLLPTCSLQELDVSNKKLDDAGAGPAAGAVTRR